MYVASAAYADRAGTADTAANALKLGGYDASDYLRKDEVQTVTAAYQEIEWTTPGTYNWVVPEGVNSILVTTVGGGGGAGYYRWRTPYTLNSADGYFHIHSGGGGAQVTPNIVLKTNPGETLTITVAAGGANANPVQNWVDQSQLVNYINKNGQDGGNSYVSRNGTIISSTLAKGGKGGSGTSHYYGGTDLNGNVFYWVSAGSPGGSGGTSGIVDGFYLAPSNKHYYRTTANSSFLGYNGSSSGINHIYGGVNYGTVTYKLHIMQGQYGGGGGGASWGDGAGYDNTGYGFDAGPGGGGANPTPYESCQSGDGLVRILAIGVTYNE